MVSLNEIKQQQLLHS